MAMKIVTHEYPSLPGKDVKKKKEFVGIDKKGKPIMENILLIPCPKCGTSLKVLQHPGTADGLPFVTCMDDCPSGAPLMVIDYD